MAKFWNVCLHGRWVGRKILRDIAKIYIIHDKWNLNIICIIYIKY